jgi:hypothetical protein
VLSTRKHFGQCLINRRNGGVTSSVSRHKTIRLIWDTDIRQETVKSIWVQMTEGSYRESSGSYGGEDDVAVSGCDVL